MQPTPDHLAQTIAVGYRDYRRRFGAITRRAGRRFESRDWEEGQEDARERICCMTWSYTRRWRRSGSSALSIPCSAACMEPWASMTLSSSLGTR